MENLPEKMRAALAELEKSPRMWISHGSYARLLREVGVTDAADPIWRQAFTQSFIKVLESAEAISDGTKEPERWKADEIRELAYIGKDLAYDDPAFIRELDDKLIARMFALFGKNPYRLRRGHMVSKIYSVILQSGNLGKIKAARDGMASGVAQAKDPYTHYNILMELSRKHASLLRHVKKPAIDLAGIFNVGASGRELGYLERMQIRKALDYVADDPAKFAQAIGMLEAAGVYVAYVPQRYTNGESMVLFFIKGRKVETVGFRPKVRIAADTPADMVTGMLRDNMRGAIYRRSILPVLARECARLAKTPMADSVVFTNLVESLREGAAPRTKLGHAMAKLQML